MQGKHPLLYAIALGCFPDTKTFICWDWKELRVEALTTHPLDPQPPQEHEEALSGGVVGLSVP